MLVVCLRKSWCFYLIAGDNFSLPADMPATKPVEFTKSELQN